MVVWAINYTQLELKNTDLTLVVQPRSSIGHLRAQDGVFLFDETADKRLLSMKRWVSFEELLGPRGEGFTHLKLAIPFTLRDKLQRRLLQYGVSELTLMPSFDDVRKWTMDYYAKHPQMLFWISQ